jgi:hypothetical protein
MLALLPFRSFFSRARRERMSFARLSASILWSSDLSGAAVEVLTEAGMRSGEYNLALRARKGAGAKFI